MDTQEQYMRDACGNMIAVENIREIDMARHELVLEMAARAKAASAELEALKNSLLDDIESFVALSVERYGVKRPGGVKGNVTLDSFDGRFRVERHIGERVAFDEGLQAAKTLIDECLHDWAQGVSANLRTLVDHAFRVDKKGKLNTGAILGLRRLHIDDDRWQRAMQAIGESLQVTGTATYVRVYERDENGKLRLVPLDMATV